eukprot:jgi/Botrbrau1/16651/Bobra.0068s0067.1
MQIPAGQIVQLSIEVFHTYFGCGDLIKVRASPSVQVPVGPHHTSSVESFHTEPNHAILHRGMSNEFWPNYYRLISVTVESHRFQGSFCTYRSGPRTK